MRSLWAMRTCSSPRPFLSDRVVGLSRSRSWERTSWQPLRRSSKRSFWSISYSMITSITIKRTRAIWRPILSYTKNASMSSLKRFSSSLMMRCTGSETNTKGPRKSQRTWLSRWRHFWNRITRLCKISWKLRIKLLSLYRSQPRLGILWTSKCRSVSNSQSLSVEIGKLLVTGVKHSKIVLSRWSDLPFLQTLLV